MAVFDHPLGHLRAFQVAKGFHSTEHCFDDVCRACVTCECGLVHILHGGLRSNWARAFSKMARSHSLCCCPGVVHERSKTLCRFVGIARDCTGSGGEPKRVMGATNGQMTVSHSRNGWRGWLPRWRRRWKQLSMPRWRHCASNTMLTSRPTKLELITSN